MLHHRGVDRNSMITGASIHNQRIERLWRDVHQSVAILYYCLFYRLSVGSCNGLYTGSVVTHTTLQDEDYMTVWLQVTWREGQKSFTWGQCVHCMQGSVETIRGHASIIMTLWWEHWTFNKALNVWGVIQHGKIQLDCLPTHDYGLPVMEPVPLCTIM